MTSRPASRFLFATIDAAGNIPPTMALVDALAARGHRVTVMSDELTREEARAAGASFMPWTRAPNNTVRSRETAFPDWELSAPDTIRFLIEQHACRWAQAFAGDVAEQLAREPADLIVAFPALLGAIIAAEARATPAALLSTGISVVPLPGIPPMGAGMAPPRTDAERAQLAKLAEHMWSAGLPALNEARTSFGLRPLQSILEQYDRVAMHVLATARAFDFASTPLPEKVRYAGPLIRDPALTCGWQSPWPPDDRRPLVLVGFSTSFQNHVACLQRVIDACAALPVRTLLTLGGSVFAHELRAAPGVMIVEHAPHTAVMKEAAIVVTHGGHGTVIAALVNRLPLLILPHGRDQEDNAVRVTERGAGLSLPNTASVEEVRTALERLLLEPRFRLAASQLGERIAAEARQSTVITDLEALARSPIDAPRSPS